MKTVLRISPMLALAAIVVGCSASSAPEGTSQVAQASQVAKCQSVQAKDSLISALVYDSWLAGYPLTRLSVGAGGTIVGASPPDLVQGDLDLINAVPDAQASVTRALKKVSGLPDYGIGGIGAATDACTSVPAWTPTGTTTINTQSFAVTPTTNPASWKTTHQEFGKECALLKSAGDVDEVDPPGDGSTNDPPSATVSATGIVANAFGLCGTSNPAGTFCKLSYATGVNWTGRWCQVYSGQFRCVLK